MDIEKLRSDWRCGLDKEKRYPHWLAFEATREELAQAFIIAAIQHYALLLLIEMRAIEKEEVFK